MRRVSDIEIEAGEAFDVRPAKAVPCKIEQSNRHPPIDGARAAKFGRFGEAILPGARKHRQGEVAVGSRRGTRWWITREQRFDELMCILAGAAAIAQRRPIVDQVTPVFKSFRLSILL